jgi:UDP-2,3-diacylglucosamine hydrolase
MIYFVSDIHLGAGSRAEARRTERAFCRWLDHISDDATALYLLGDIFDFWFEYQRVVSQGFVRVLGRLATLVDNGTRVVFYTGNHDMWCYDYLERECGIEVVTAPRVETLAGRSVHLAHGDNMNIDGQPLLKLMNSAFRSRVLRVIFSWIIHPDLFLRFGQWWSGKSRKSHGADPESVERLGCLVDYARCHHSQHPDTDAYIFGHMHIPHRHVDATLDVLFMSHWSGDVATYATMDESGNFDLKTFVIDETISGTSA